LQEKTNLSELHAKTLKRLKAHAAAKGLLLAALTTTDETTRRLMSFIDNLLI